jgi:hypothetical protein
MAEIIYGLCGLTSFACAVLLARSWRQKRQHLLLWSTACFAALALNNAVLIVDLVFVPGVDLGLLRNAVAFVGVAFLLAGLIWETT